MTAASAAATVGGHMSRVVPGDRIVAFGWGSLNPVHWLGSAVSTAAQDGWEAAMVALFSAGMWVMQLVFHIIDAFTTPDLTATGPLHDVLPTTYWVAGALAGILFTGQLALAAFRRDGLTFGKTLVGMVQFGAAWIGFLTFAGTIILACSGLQQGLLSSMLHVNHWSDWTTGTAWPSKVSDVTVATVLGLGVSGIVIPASLAYLLLMLVREAGLLVLVATSPIAAAGLLMESTRTWFWKMLRWFLAAAAMAPLIALVVGMGVQMTTGVLSTTNINGTAAQVGQAVVSAVLLAVGALSPVVLFKLLAFVDPNTASGQAMRSSLSANGGLSGLLSGSGGGEAGSGAAAEQSSDGSGRSEGESQSDSATSSRFAAAMATAGSAASGAGGMVLAGAQLAKNVADKAAAFAESALGGAGVGHGGQGEGSSSNSGGRHAGGSSGESSSSAKADAGPDAGSAKAGATSNGTQQPQQSPAAGPTTPAAQQPERGPAGPDGARGGQGEPGPAGAAPAAPTPPTTGAGGAGFSAGQSGEWRHD